MMIDVTDYPQKQLKGVRSWPILARVWSSGERQASGVDILSMGEAVKLVFTLVDQKVESTERH